MIRLFICLAWGFILFALGVAIFAYRTTAPENAEALRAMYAEVKATSLSGMARAFAPIVRTRINCFTHSERSMVVRNRCLSRYVDKVVAQTESDVKSLPDKPAFMICVRRCPIMASMCKGEASSNGIMDCSETELRCLDYCLDQHWRGRAIRPHVFRW